MSFQPQAPYRTIEEEFEARLRKAFGGHSPADFVVIDSVRQQFQMAMVEYGQSRGWLDDGAFFDNEIEQYSCFRYRLTAAGKQHFQD